MLRSCQNDAHTSPNTPPKQAQTSPSTSPNIPNSLHIYYPNLPPKLSRNFASQLTFQIPGMGNVCAGVGTRGSLSASSPTLRFAERIARAESAPTAQHLCGPVRLGPGLLNLSHALHFSRVLIMSANHGIRLPIETTSSSLSCVFSGVILKSAAIA